MRKKFGIVACCTFIVVSVTAMLIFIFSGNKIIEGDSGISLKGTWKVVSVVDNNTVSLPENNYIIFENENAIVYRGKTDSPFAKSEYTIDKNLNLKLSELSRQYAVRKLSNNIIRLYESKTIYMNLIKYSGVNMADIPFDVANINGRWNVVYRNTDEIIHNEYLVFKEERIYDYRNGSEEPISSSEYSIKNGKHLIAKSWSKDMILTPLSENRIILVETDTGYVWELEKNLSK
ncbi:MAG: hypothetical protein IJA34_05400 [Lachnospiraceae bacterium]|nr:hypothetical protein [Lachnospiraceae bacterium]